MAALFLTANGVLLYAAEKLRNRGTSGSHRKGVQVTTTAAREDVEGDAVDYDHLAAAGVPGHDDSEASGPG